MNITFLVGNGFDIATGLKTGYNSFYEWYCQQPSDENNGALQEFKNTIKEYVEKVKANKNVKDETWADFELGLGAYTACFDENGGDDFLQCREDAFSKMLEYLKGEEEKFDAEHLTEEDVKKIRTELGQFYRGLKPSQADHIKKTIASTTNENVVIKFISFNYTDVLDQVVKRLAEEPIKSWVYNGGKNSYKIDSDVLHVNGKLDEYPILAVNDESQIANQKLLPTIAFKESMIKVAGVQAMGRNWYSAASSIIDSSRFICIFGMSLGATDKRWWEKIIEWLSGSDYRRLVIFQHLERSISRTSIAEFVRNENEVVQKLLSFSNFSEQKKQSIRSRIYVAFNVDYILHLEDKLKVPALV